MIAALVALAAATCFALSTVSQHRAASTAPAQDHGGLGLVLQLLRRPLWLAGLVAGAAGFALHSLALSLGTLVVVQPLLVSGLLLVLPIGVLVEHRHPSGGEWVLAAVVVVGLASFLLAAHPAPGRGRADLPLLVVATTVSAGVAVTATVLGSTVARRYRAALFGLTGGICFGAGGALLKDVVGQLSASLPAVLASWELYAMAVAGLAGVVATQVSYQAGSLTASQPAVTIAEPVVAAGTGAFAFGEHLASSPGAVLVQVVGAVLMVGGVVGLAALTASPAAPAPLAPPGDPPQDPADQPRPMTGPAQEGPR